MKNAWIFGLLLLGACGLKSSSKVEPPQKGFTTLSADNNVGVMGVWEMIHTDNSSIYMIVSEKKVTFLNQCVTPSGEKIEARGDVVASVDDKNIHLSENLDAGDDSCPLHVLASNLEYRVDGNSLFVTTPNDKTVTYTRPAL
ncbi:MAG: hypothetical protein JST16_15590 [Bdellovibrionales bacterium]|nr:hypothetical protein [Bdellovibrionales bacterium]